MNSLWIASVCILMSSGITYFLSTRRSAVIKIMGLISPPGEVSKADDAMPVGDDFRRGMRSIAVVEMFVSLALMVVWIVIVSIY